MAVAVLALGCGRIGFDDVDARAASDSGPDADARADADSAPVDSGVPTPYAVPIGGSGSDDAWGVAVDSAGNAYVAGRFDGDLTIGTEEFSSRGMDDVWVASFAPDGSPRWAHAFGSPDDDASFGLGVGPDDGIYITGHVRGAADLGLGLTTAGGSGDLFVVRYDMDGAVVWANQYPDSGHSSGDNVTFDPSGDLVVTGTFGGTGDFGLRPVDAGAGANGLVLGLVAGDGVTRFVRHYGVDAAIAVRGAAVDSLGGILIGGLMEGDVDFGGGLLTIGAGASSDGFAAAFDADGSHRWSFEFGASSGFSQNVAVDSEGNSYFCGNTDVGVDFGGRVSIPSGGGIILGLDPDGAHRWSQHIPGMVPREVIVCAGELWVVGRAGTGSVDAGGGIVPSHGGTDAFIAQYTLDGTHLRSERIGGALDDSATAVACGSDGAIHVAGRFDTAARLNGIDVTAAAGQDAFVMRLVP